MQLKVGEWYLHGTDLVQVKSKDKYGYSLSTGVISIGTRGKTVYPLTLDNKRTADEIEFYRKEMRDMCRSVNWPGIANWIEESLCDAAGNEEKQKAVLCTMQQMRNKLAELDALVFEGTGLGIFRR